MREFINKKVLITTAEWFYGKDGRSYKAVHGTLLGIHEAANVLGFTPNRAHANWFYEIGEMRIMGCQVMYIIECESVAEGKVQDWSTVDCGSDGIKYFERPSSIYQVK